MANNNPLVSIIMGIYNCENTLNQSIDSILNQTYKNWELIMCDDCSKDNTFNIAKEYQKKYPNKIILIKNNKNLTLAPTLNKCLKLARGEYIARQDGDDISVETRIEDEIKFLLSNERYDMVGANVISFDEKAENGLHIMKCNPKKMDLLMNGCPFVHGSIIMKHSVFDKLGGYNTKWYARQLEDYELWARFFQNGYKAYNIQKNLYKLRENSDSYKRRGAKRRLRGIILNFKIYHELNAPISCYKNVIKDLIAIFIPNKIFKMYYRNKLK